MAKKIKSWFGTRWQWPVLANAPRAQTPVGTPCLRCGKQIAADDQGIFFDQPSERPLHRRCFYAFVFNRRRKRSKAASTTIAYPS